MRWRLSGVALALALALALPGAASSQEEGFPHADHQGLFPLCSGCHQVSPSASRGITLPTSEACARCHDGKTRTRVQWSGPRRGPSNLDFSHASHPEVAEEGEGLGCRACHSEPEALIRMAVAPARPGSCLSCHEHEAPEHLAPRADCLRCHLPLTRATELPPDRVAELPHPGTHREPAFVLKHGAAAQVSGESCSVCHARESCERCHLNAGALPSIRSLGTDLRVAALVEGRSPEYPEPGSHQGGAWRWEHGSLVRDDGVGSCANCHTRPACRSCHLDDPADGEFSRLPSPPAGDPRGTVPGLSSRNMHEPGFGRGHKIEASASGSCESCHRRSEFCVSCHAGSSDPGFHLDNFMVQHAAEAYGNESECASCHNPELFCRSCHEGTGLASQGRLDAGFHNARPFWLLEHGDGARKGLESCTTCHAQNDCAQCHSARGGWRVSPHGPDFDARRMRDQAPLTCLRCHFGDPLRGGP